MDWINLHNVVNAVVFAGIGLLILTLAFVIFDRITPGKLWEEIVDKSNTALAIIAGAWTLAIAMIIAAAIRG
ncbi:MAG: DUF350 domain-containing protein [Leptospirales bacterium]|nr:DUF350 domain-containing protein [Leptospirales bacterium]